MKYDCSGLDTKMPKQRPDEKKTQKEEKREREQSGAHTQFIKNFNK